MKICITPEALGRNFSICSFFEDHFAFFKFKKKKNLVKSLSLKSDENLKNFNIISKNNFGLSRPDMHVYCIMHACAYACRALGERIDLLSRPIYSIKVERNINFIAIVCKNT